MTNILSDGARPVLDEVARERMLLAFDFDGTLAPLSDDRDAARMRDTTHALLRLVALLHPCAVISGRARADVASRVEGIPLVAIIGNHGAEAGHGPVDRSVRDVVVAWHDAVRSRLCDLQGVEIEDKGLSLAIHYRLAASRELAEQAVTAATGTLEGARVFRGHAVVNVVPRGLHDKGMALSQVASRVAHDRALYLGDDTTDEDAFRNQATAVGVRVGTSPSSAARYYVSSQAEVDEFLRALVRARRRLDGQDERIEGLERMVAP